MNPRELLVRLNVPAVRYELGRGGLPELTSLDIAAALGMIEDEFGREVLIVLWWSEGARPGWLHDYVRTRVLAEYASRERSATSAKLELHMAQTEYDARRHHTLHDRRILEACMNAEMLAKADRWPWNPALYGRFCDVVLDELRDPDKCTICKGRGNVLRESLWVSCIKCNGTGHKKEKKTWRANRLGLKEHVYRNTWDRVYQWVYFLIADAERNAANELSRRLAKVEAHEAA